MSAAIHIKDAASMDRLAAFAALHFPHRLPLIRAAKAGHIAMAEYTRTAPPQISRLKRMGRPMVALIGDDDHMPSGPAGWPAALPLIGWARAIILHGAGGEAEQYAGAVIAARLHGRLLMIETDNAHLAAWAAIMPRGKPVLLIRPSDHRPHPRPVPKAAMH